QGQDTLRRVASEGISFHALFLVVAMFVVGLASWGWSRFLLNCPVPADLLDLSQTMEADRARFLLRRTCGVLPFCGIGVGFLLAAANSGVAFQCLALAAVSFLSGVVFWFLCKPLKRAHLTLSQTAQMPRRQKLSGKEVLSTWRHTKSDEAALQER